MASDKTAEPAPVPSAAGANVKGNAEEQPLIEILLTTFNGERFLAEQLDSIVAQTHENWRILVRDDESTDGTVKILSEFLRKIT